MNENTGVSAHWSYWVIVGVALIFNLAGCVNYITQMNAEMVASMPEAYRAIVEGRPPWGTGAFAIAVFGGVLGCALLLFRKQVAAHVLIASLVGVVVAQIPVLGMTGIPIDAWIGWLSQLLVSGFLVWYSKWAMDKGWLS